MFRPVRIIVTKLKQTRNYYTVDSSKARKDETTLPRMLYSKIKATGPITVADYMKDVLTNPFAGYYMHKDMFGEGGDFITSPELGQIFGELVAVWFLNEWSKVGCPKPLQIVELGPGRGTLSQDLLRVFDHFKSLKSVSLNLVEVSPTLSDLQARNLCMQNNVISDADSLFYRQGISHQGIPVKWYRSVEDLPNMFTLLIAHEFFDALPVHKFERTERGFREVLIDIDPANELQFRFVLARDETPMQKLFVNQSDKRDHIEVSPLSLTLIKSIAKRLEEYGGFALIADYGHDGTGKDSFRAFKKHKLHHPLVEPGSADLTADVDFGALKKAASENGGVIPFGPISQRDFLRQMGIEHRLQKLKANANEQQIKSLDYAYNMMTNESEMGNRFKVLALMPQVIEDLLKKHPPAGFV